MRYKNSIVAVALSLLILLSATASNAKTICVTDALGRKVFVHEPVKRAVFLIGYELIPYLGIWNRVVGISLWAKTHDDFMNRIGSAWLKSVASVGTATQINFETLIKLNPDLVITWNYKPQAVKLLETLGKKDGFSVITISPEGLDSLFSTLRMLGKVFEVEKRTDCIIKKMHYVFDTIRTTLAKLKNRRIHGIWLWDSINRVAGSTGVVPDLMNIAGIINCAASIKAPYPRVSLEQIVLWNPEIIFIWGNANYGTKKILNDPRLSTLIAVKEKAVFKSPNWSTWSPRAALVCLWMALKAYPNAFHKGFLTKMQRDFDSQISYYKP